MPLAHNYESLEEAQRRLLNTVVLYDGDPVWVTDVRQCGQEDRRAGAANNDIVRVEFQRLPVTAASVTERKYISSRKFDFSPFKMGFIELNDGLFYLSRTTGRQYQQGLSDNNIHVTSVNDSQWNNNLSRLVSNPELHKCIKGQYKSFYEAMDAAQGVFARSFALYNDTDLGLSFVFHKDRRCGYVKDRRIVLGPAFKYLSQELESCNAPL